MAVMGDGLRDGHSRPVRPRPGAAAPRRRVATRLLLVALLVLAGCGAGRGPTPAPATSSGTPGPSVVVNFGPRDRVRVALTFDSDSPGGHGLAIMQWLAEHRVPASIFMTGDWADNTPFGPGILEVIQAHPDLFTIGNHSATHPHFPQLTAAQMLDELHAAEASIGRFVSADLRPWWRPPYGEYDDAVLATAGAAGYRFTVLADVGLPDYQPLEADPPGPTAEQLVTRALGKTTRGSIIGLHLGGYETYAALPRLVAALQAKGFELVTLATLLGS